METKAEDSRILLTMAMDYVCLAKKKKKKKGTGEEEGGYGKEGAPVQISGLARREKAPLLAAG